MAFDLLVGKSPNINDNPFFMTGIEFDQTPMIERLYKRYGGVLLMHLANPFTDFKMGGQILMESKEHMYELITNDTLSTDEKALVFSIAAIVCFASDKGLVLYGQAD